jgi:hypothetical protein
MIPTIPLSFVFEKHQTHPPYMIEQILILYLAEDGEIECTRKEQIVQFQTDRVQDIEMKFIP